MNNETGTSAKTESFADLFEKSLATIDLTEGAVVEATVVAVEPERIIVNAGLKSEDRIPLQEFRDEDVKVGDTVEVVVVKADNGFGETRLSREKAKRAREWIELDKLHEENAIITGKIIERVKGGFTVEVGTIRAFLPGSLVDSKPVRDPGYLEGKELEFKIIKMDQKRNNIVVSRRAVMEAEMSVERAARMEELQEGQEINGIVKNITDYGAFVDLGGLDGLLHITDMAWRRVKHPSEMLNVGDEIRVKILKFDRDKNRVSLGIKQLGDDPWQNILGRYPKGEKFSGKITNITDYGCFVELEEGVEGLVHMSEMDWTNKNVHPSKVVQSGEEVEVIVLDIDEDRRRISLGIKQCKRNPWLAFAEDHQEGEKVSGKIRSITDFGMFIGLEGGIDGLVHLSDISWSQAGEEAVRDYKKGDEVEAVILAVDAERERISLGIKQFTDDPLAKFIETQGGQDAVLKAKVVNVDEKQAVLALSDDVSAILRIADYDHERTKDLREELKPEQELDVKCVSIDNKTRQIVVSRKALLDEPEVALKKVAAKEPTKTTLGDLLREQIEEKDSK